MTEFVVNTDMFGQYVRIPTGYSREPHIYKVVSLFQSNTYCDVPIVAASVPVPHKKEFTGLDSLEHVLNVIHCGIDESKVIRVALKDCEIVEMQTSASEELQRYREIGTVEDFERLAYLKKRYEDETYDYCGEYGANKCELKDRVEKLQEYEAIGTVEECRELKKRNTPKKIELINGGISVCPECGAKVKRCYDFCKDCGQAIDWSEEE